jgi:predicted extracellular nuclease
MQLFRTGFPGAVLALAAGLLIPWFANAQEGGNLLISGTIEGSGNNKAIQVKAVGGSVILSGYKIGLFRNGNAQDNPATEYDFPSDQTLAEGGTYEIVNRGAAQKFQDTAGVANDGGVTNFNGNDALVLFKNGSTNNGNVVVDSIGQLGSRSNFNKDVTLVRKSSVTTGRTDPTAAFDLSEYDRFSKNTMFPPSTTITDDEDDEDNRVDPILISAIQGTEEEPQLLGQRVTVEAIVIGDFQNGASGEDGDLGGFFLQEEDAENDDNPLTSEGIFVFQGGDDSTTEVSIGDKVRVVGTVANFSGMTQMDQIESVTIVSSGNELPTPAFIKLLDGRQPVTALEKYEGMRVVFSDDLVLSEMFNLDRYGEVVLFAGPRPYQYSQINRPDADGFAAYQAQLAQRRITYDDGYSTQNRFIAEEVAFQGFENFSTGNAPRMGDTIQGLSGVLRFARSGAGDRTNEYRVHATSADRNVFVQTNPRPLAPPDVDGDGGVGVKKATLKMASVNVLNFFVTLDDGSSAGPNRDSEPRGAESQEEYERQVEKLVTYLVTLNADVMALAEVENLFPDSLAALVDALNLRVGNTEYAFVNPGRAFVDNSDVMSVGFIYKTGVVSVRGSPAILDDSNVDPSLNAMKPIFNGPSTNRAALAATFVTLEEEECITITACHFKSKGSGGADGTIYEDKGDGAGAYNLRRLYAAQAVDLWLQDNPTGDDVVCKHKAIAGDLNAYASEDPVLFFTEEAGYRSVESSILGYSYVFNGQIGTLDYILVNAPLYCRVTGAGVWHINEDEADYLDYNLDSGKETSVFDGASPARASDHSPVLVGFDMTENGGAPPLATSSDNIPEL